MSVATIVDIADKQGKAFIASSHSQQRQQQQQHPYHDLSTNGDPQSQQRLLPRSRQLPFRERLSQFYYDFFGVKTNRFIFFASVVLLVVSFFSRESVAALWYHILEGLLTFLFALEIGIRLIVMRSSFWESRQNIIEVVACTSCVFIFAILHVSRNPDSVTRREHQVLITLRYVSQVLRMGSVVVAEGRVQNIFTPPPLGFISGSSIGAGGRGPVSSGMHDVFGGLGTAPSLFTLQPGVDREGSARSRPQSAFADVVEATSKPIGGSNTSSYAFVTWGVEGRNGAHPVQLGLAPYPPQAMEAGISGARPNAFAFSRHSSPRLHAAPVGIAVGCDTRPAPTLLP